ncbi:MAG: hypothetical protein II885_17765 [Oscillospiraceae bacterium]|nr:hypothetical protein [Oscillospiraceae bacterium]
MAKKSPVNFQNYDFNANPDNFTVEETITIKTMMAAGEPIYLAPIRIEIREQLENLHTDYAHCRTWHIGAEAITVKLTPANEAIYDMMVNILRSEHRDGVRKSRCLVRGKRGKLVRCDENNRCAQCPYKLRPEDRLPQEVSWDELTDQGIDPAAADTTSAPVLFDMAVEDARRQMAAEDPRLVTVYDMLDEHKSIDDIMAALGISQRRVYQLIARCREIVKANL